MAYSYSPEFQTYSSPSIPVAYDIDFRLGFQVGSPSARIDAGMINLIPKKYRGEDDKELIGAESRPTLNMPLTVASGLSGVLVRGLYVWEYQQSGVAYIVVVGQTVYGSVNGGSTWTTLFSFATNVTTPIGFAEFLNGTNQKSLIVVDGTEGYKITEVPGPALTSAKITDTDFPSPHVPYPVFIDGYLFLAKAATGDIYNSDLNDPTSWTPGNFISSELYPDDVLALTKIDNYLVAIGIQGTEYFYDAGIATGSPLARYEGGLLPFGTMFPSAMANAKNRMVVLANNNDGEVALMLVEGFKYKDITPHWLVSYLENTVSTIGTYVSGYRVRGHFLRLRGKLYYGLRMPGIVAGQDSYFVYCFDTEMWTEFTGNNYASFPAFEFANSVTHSAITHAAGLSADGTQAYLGLFSYGGTVEVQGVTTYNVPVELRTPPLDFGTLNRKFMGRFGVAAVNAFGGGTATSLNLYARDTDSAWTNIGAFVTTGSVDYPFITQLGQFRQRSFKITYSGASSVLFKNIIVDVNKGIR